MAAIPVSYSESASLPCRFCGQGFTQDDTIISYGSRSFHKRCFSCNKCRKAFSTPQDAEGAVRELPYCNNCFKAANTQLCAGCGEELTSRVLKPSGTSKRYHEGCFKCETCNKSLITGYKIVKGRSVCNWACGNKQPQVEAAAPETFCDACGIKRQANVPECPQCGETYASPKKPAAAAPPPAAAPAAEAAPSNSCPCCHAAKEGSKFCTSCGYKF
eukprot:g19170.t1